MTDILCKWLNEEVKLSRRIGKTSFFADATSLANAMGAGTGMAAKCLATDPPHSLIAMIPVATTKMFILLAQPLA